MDARWKGQHVGTFGDIGMFSFQEFKQLSTGDGAMITLSDESMAERLETVWAFSGESPVHMTLNWRMNEVTAAIGLAQLQRVRGIIRDYYNVGLKLFNDAIEGCRWLKKRHIPPEAIQSGYWFACTWDGDKAGLDYDRFKKLNEELNIGLRFGFNEVAPYQFDFFRRGDIYGHGVPYHTPPFTELSDYRYRDGLCPVVEEVMPRLVTVSLIFLPLDEARRQADALLEAITIMEKG